MKLLVMSDSHRNLKYMRLAVAQTTPDAIIHLGDNIGDAQKLSNRFPDTVFHMVIGNCDILPSGGATELFLTLEGAKILATHGHIYGVKNGLSALTDRALQIGADIVLYGHTHRAMLNYEYGLWIMCPGQLERHDKFLAASYGVITIENGAFNCGIAYIVDSD